MAAQFSAATATLAAASSDPQGVLFQGNTNIKASQKNAVAVGKNNAAPNEAGVIGGK